MKKNFRFFPQKNNIIIFEVGPQNWKETVPKIRKFLLEKIFLNQNFVSRPRDPKFQNFHSLPFFLKKNRPQFIPKNSSLSLPQPYEHMFSGALVLRQTGSLQKEWGSRETKYLTMKKLSIRGSRECCRSSFISPMSSSSPSFLVCFLCPLHSCAQKQVLVFQRQHYSFESKSQLLTLLHTHTHIGHKSTHWSMFTRRQGPRVSQKK